MANTIKYSQEQRKEIVRLYGLGREEGGAYTDGSRFYSKGRYNLRQISEKTGVPIASVNGIAKGIR